MGDDGEERENSPAVVSGEVLLEPRRGPDGKLAPGGGSLNPGGRSKAEREVVDLARQRGPEVIKRLFQIAMRRSDGAAVRAAEVLLERGFGKAPLKFTDADGKKLQIRGIIIMPAERGDSDEEGGDDGE